MNTKFFLDLSKNCFLFWLSRKLDYPILPPDTVQMNFSFKCNLSCKMCSMEAQGRLLESEGKQTEIDSETFRKTIRETVELGTKTFLFIGGEPFLRSDLFDLVGYAKGLGLNTVIVTNGVLLTEENISRCFKNGADWLSISIDSASKENFSKIRGVDVLDRIISNVKTLNHMKKSQGQETPRLVTVCTIMDDNIHELMDVVGLCRELGIARIIFQPVVANNIDQTQRQDLAPGFVPKTRLNQLDESIDRLIVFKKESLENFDFVANSIKQLKLIKGYFRGKVSPRAYPCYAGYNRVQIVQEGKLYFCVNQQQHVANFGDIKKDTLKDMWYSKKARSYRQLIRKCRYPCLQWCSYRDEFIQLQDAFYKKLVFGVLKRGQNGRGAANV
ncbi:MAG: radical SAM protein [Candidatus Omnitrophica bacterium]|nr:radical SAM protein [Candidatus Omnitrophota bacterium]